MVWNLLPLPGMHRRVEKDRLAGALGVALLASMPAAATTPGGGDALALHPPILATISLFALLGTVGLLCVVLPRSWRRSRPGPADPQAVDHFRVIAEAVGDIGFEYCDRTGHLSWTADVGMQLLGYREGEAALQPETFQQFVHPDDVAEIKTAWETLGDRQRVEMELRLLQKDGQWVWVHLCAVPLRPPRGAHGQWVGTVRRTQALHAVKDALDEARRMETVGTMAGGIAHEFNNHLTPIRGYLELALDELDEGHTVVEGLQTALERVEHCTKLVRQIQAYGRKSLMLPRAEDVAGLLPTMVRLAMSTDREQAGRVTLVEEVPEALPPALVDQAQLHEAVVQLVRNALEAMPEGGTLTVRANEVYRHQGIAAGSSESRAYVAISIIDTGEGIDPSNQRHIFDPFFTTRGRAKARGMGLSMVQGMVAQHEGYIEVESAVGRGTEVRILLPLLTASAGEAEADADSDGTMQVLPAAPLGRLLVADDEPAVRQIVSRVFAREGWCVEELTDALGIAERLTSPSPPDLLILDLIMPGPPPEETLALLARLPHRTKVLLISGYDQDARIQRLVAMTDVAFLGKPFSPKVLLSAVDTLMAAPAA